MAKFRNGFLFILTTVILCCTVLLNVIDRVGVDLPQWLSVNQKESLLEGRKYSKRPPLNSETITSGKFGALAEKYVADLVPMRDTLLLANARLQRLSISSMADLFGYEVYPTYFNSKAIYSKSSQMVMQNPVNDSSVEQEKIDSFISGITRFSEKHPDKNTYFYLPPRLSVFPTEDTLSLISNPIDLESRLLDKFPESVTVIDTKRYSQDEISEYMFRGDHHWNIKGGYDAYHTIASALNYDVPDVSEVDFVEFENPGFYGSSDRIGLLPGVRDSISDIDFELPDTTIWVSGEKHDMSFVESRVDYEAGK